MFVLRNLRKPEKLAGNPVEFETGFSLDMS